MKIICAGYGKTGTKSIAKALRHLGFTVFDWEEQTFDFVDHWVDVFQNGAKPDVKRVYQNADVCIDMPGNFFYEEILEAFPDCKVILERETRRFVGKKCYASIGLLVCFSIQDCVHGIANSEENRLRFGFLP